MPVADPVFFEHLERNMHKLILWDVDGTLLHTQGIAGEEMRAAMSQVFGPLAQRERTFYSGKTDWQIIHDTFPHLPPSVIEENMAVFVETYAERLNQRRHDLFTRSRTFPGVMAVLARLQERGVVQAPLTGNIAPVAHLKLDVLGLLDYLDPNAGAYGSDHHERPKLVPIAAQRASGRYGCLFEGHTIVIVGDTPNDIHCGKQNGTRTVAVATGPYSTHDLQTYEPDAVLPNLSNVESAVAAILGE